MTDLVSTSFPLGDGSLMFVVWFFGNRDAERQFFARVRPLDVYTYNTTVPVCTYYNIAITGRAKTVDGFLMAAFESSGNQNRTNIITDTYIPRIQTAAAAISVRSDCIIMCIDANM